MRYGIALPSYGPLATPENLLRLARHATPINDMIAQPGRVAGEVLS